MPPDATPSRSPLLGCPEDDLLSRFAEGTLSPAGRADVESHVAGCEACRQVVAGLARAGVLPRASALRRGRLLGLPRPALAAVAAAVVLALGAALLLRREAPTADTDARLLAAAKDLAARRPDLFAGFTPLGAAERRADVVDVRRGGLALLLPAGTTLSTRPDFRWAPAPGATAYEVTVVDAEGTTVLRSTTTEPALPGARLPRDLPRGGDFVWKVRASGGAVAGEGTKAFSVAREDVVQGFAAAREAIEALAPEAPRYLILAHYALRRGLLAEALDAARRHASAHPGDRAGRETLDHVLRAVGPGATGLR